MDWEIRILVTVNHKCETLMLVSLRKLRRLIDLTSMTLFLKWNLPMTINMIFCNFNITLKSSLGVCMCVWLPELILYKHKHNFYILIGQESIKYFVLRCSQKRLHHKCLTFLFFYKLILDTIISVYVVSFCMLCNRTIVYIWEMSCGLLYSILGGSLYCILQHLIIVGPAIFSLKHKRIHVFIYLPLVLFINIPIVWYIRVSTPLRCFLKEDPTQQIYIYNQWYGSHFCGVLTEEFKLSCIRFIIVFSLQLINLDFTGVSVRVYYIMDDSVSCTCLYLRVFRFVFNWLLFSTCLSIWDERGIDKYCERCSWQIISNASGHESVIVKDYANVR